jgi:hypothetical protein
MGRAPGVDNDYWFFLKFKLAWKDAPKPPAPVIDQTAAIGYGDYGRVPSTGKTGGQQGLLPE